MRLLRNLAGLASLYLVQGIVAGIGVVLVQVAQAAGAPLEEQAGLVAWGGLPWVLKLVWGVLLDRLVPPGRAAQRWVMLAAQLATAAALYGLAGRVTDMAALATAWFVLNAIASAQDVTADAFAIDAVEPERRGLANAVMAGARAFGAGFLGTMVIARLMGDHGLEGAIHLLALASAFAAVPIVFVATPSQPARAPIEWGELSRSMLEGPFFAGSVLASLVLFADAATGAVVWEFLTNHGGWTQQDALRRLLPWGAAFELIGFGVAAMVVDRLGARRMVVVCSAILGAVWIGFGFAGSLWSDHSVVMGLASVEGLARAGMMVGVYAVLMNSTAPRLRATHFVIFMAMINLGRVVGPLVAPALVAAAGFSGLYVAAGVLQLAIASGVRAWVREGVV